MNTSSYFENLLNTPVQKKTAVVLGNGPSLRGFDFKKELEGFDVFGMNAAYRYWDAINWYPDYYSCLDKVVGISHKKEIARLIEKRETYGIKAFFLQPNLIRELGSIGKQVCVVNFLGWLIRQNFFRFPDFDKVTTGSHTLCWAVTLGYREIILLGIDGNYVVEILPETENREGVVLEMIKTPEHNPNYFFDGYQQKGDKYNIPNPLKNEGYIMHQKSWDYLLPLLRLMDITVVNANSKSCVDAFPKCDFRQALHMIKDIKAKRYIKRDDSGYAGLHDRSEGLALDEIAVIGNFLPTNGGVMFDVGSHRGGSFLPFLRRGYSVYAFEPSRALRTALLINALKADLSGCRERLHIDSRAVSDESGLECTWYTTDESSGASSMTAFTAVHKKAGMVTTVALRDYCREHEISRVDFLKIDTEGYDLPVLRGFPFENIRPVCILCEFEDRKTSLLGYTMHNLAVFLLEQNYYVYVSEWHPVLRYGIQHQWRRITPYPTDCDPLSWGNILAFAEKPEDGALRNAVLSAVSKERKRTSCA